MQPVAKNTTARAPRSRNHGHTRRLRSRSAQECSGVARGDMARLDSLLTYVQMYDQNGCDRPISLKFIRGIVEFQ